MSNPIQPTKKQTEPDTDDKQQGRPAKPSASRRQRGIAALELLFVASTIGAAVLTMAPKIPKSEGD